MATSFDVNLTIGSGIGFNIVGRGIIRGLTPVQTTTLTLDGDVYASPGYYLETRTLSVPPLNDFVSSPGNTSTRQMVYMINSGTAALTVTDILYSINEGISSLFYFYSTATVVNGSTITIPPGETVQFQLAYLAPNEGEYAGYFIIKSNNDSGYYQVNTRQLVNSSSNFEISPSSATTTVTNIGHNSTVTYSVLPIVNNIDRPDLIIPITGAVTGSAAWSISAIGDNTMTMKFNPYEINNVNGTYISTLTITSNSISHQVTNTAVVNIDFTKNKNLSSWTSPASHYNSIVGISYDLEDDVRYLTIGVGTGGDGSPIYNDGGIAYANVNSLGLGANTVGTPYAFWATVYRIPFTSSAQVYYSNDYMVKTTDGLDYHTYFGEYTAPGSMFVVSDDGYGSLTIEMNHLRELSEDTELNATLNNLTRAFYYYSAVDVDNRYEPLPTEYAAPIALHTDTTQLFIGFNYNTRDKLAFINTSIVPLPA